MKARIASALFFTLVVAAWSAPVQAQYLEDFVHTMKRDFRRNNCWPEPFVRADRVTARVPFAMMVHSGWQRQNLLGSFHFEENGLDLNEAGQLKVRWILAETPAHHRIIYVERAETEEQTAARVAAVAELAGRFAINDETPSVVATNITHAGWPADQVDNIGRKFHASMPDPRLPKAVRDGDK
jgi:hypothetical protein